MKELFKTCFHEPSRIFHYEGVTYYAADEDGIEHFGGDLVINLTKNPGTKEGATPYKIPELKRHMVDLPDEIVLFWEDFGQPPVKASFWNALHAYAKKKKYKSVCFRCAHGHGRTGTGVVAMMIANLGTKAEETILDVRERYCRGAVESESQVVYLLHLDEYLNDRAAPEDEELDEVLARLVPRPKIMTKLMARNFINDL